MLPKDLVVFLEQDCRGSGQRLAFAAQLAKRWQAHLIATFICRPLALDPHAGFAMGAGLSAMLEGYQAKKASALERARKEFDDLTERRSFSAEWRVSDDEPYEALMLHARHASLAILGPPERQQASTTVLGLSERTIFASGRPCLLLPIDWPADRTARRIVVGWNGSREATRAIADAMPFLAAADTVHLVVVPDAGTKGLYGQDPGADMAAHFSRHGVPVVLEQQPGTDAGAALLQRCAAIGADLLVMGAKGRSDVSEFLFGGATRTVFGATQAPVLLSA